jgi:hypothetical protein
MNVWVSRRSLFDSGSGDVFIIIVFVFISAVASLLYVAHKSRKESMHPMAQGAYLLHLLEDVAYV